MFEPPRPRRSRVWPVLAIVVAAGLAAGVAFGGSWYLLILAGVVLWGFFGVRFLMSDRGKRILFSRFDDNPHRDRNL